MKTTIWKLIEMRQKFVQLARVKTDEELLVLRNELWSRLYLSSGEMTEDERLSAELEVSVILEEQKSRL